MTARKTLTPLAPDEQAATPALTKAIATHQAAVSLMT